MYTQHYMWLPIKELERTSTSYSKDRVNAYSTEISEAPTSAHSSGGMLS